MPTLATSYFPPPKSWEDLEILISDLLRCIWRAPHVVRHGRQGQSQQGVDIYGIPRDADGRTHGVQVRGKAEIYGAKLLARELVSAAEEAKKFSPPLECFYLVTSSRRDATIQDLARRLTSENQLKGLFQVHVWGWEDVEEQLARYPDLVRLHFPQYFGQAIAVQMIPTLEEPQTKVRGEEEVTGLVTKIDKYISMLTNSREQLWIGNRNSGQESQSVNQYFEWIQEWAWEAIPEDAQSLIPDRTKMTEGEIMMYVGWPNNTAVLRVMIDRQLLKLRQVKALLLGDGKAINPPQ